MFGNTFGGVLLYITCNSNHYLLSYWQDVNLYIYLYLYAVINAILSYLKSN